jgi:hypothetical protein
VGGEIARFVSITILLNLKRSQLIILELFQVADEMRFIFVELSVDMDRSLIFFEVLVTDVLGVIGLVLIDLFEVILVVVRVCVLHFILSRLLI